MQTLLDSQYKIMHDGDKYTKVNATNIVTDNPVDSEDLDPTQGEIKENTGSTQRPPEAQEDGLRTPT